MNVYVNLTYYKC